MMRRGARRGGMVALALGVMAGLALPAQAAPLLQAVGVESQYADVMAQIGGAYVRVDAIETNPNTDPHEFEISPQVAAAWHGADVIVANGLGYEAWAGRLLADKKVILAQRVLGLPANTPNPHLWYGPQTMAALAPVIAQAFAVDDPAHAAIYRANAAVFVASLKPWHAAIAALRARDAGAPVAVSEPVADDLLQAAGLHIVTPFALQAAAMNGTDPAPQDVATQEALLRTGKVRLFIYNRQVVSPLSRTFLAIARKHHVPVVGVDEIMPPGQHYQHWMLTTTKAIASALQDGPEA